MSRWDWLLGGGVLLWIGFALFGIISIHQQLGDDQDTVTQVRLNQIHGMTVLNIQNDLEKDQALAKTMIQGFDGLHAAYQTTGFYSKESLLNLMAQPRALVGFTSIRLLVSRIVHSDLERDEIISFASQIHERPMQPFRLVNGTFDFTPWTDYPYGITFVGDPFQEIPPLPDIGLPDILERLPEDTVAQILALTPEEFLVTEAEKITDVEGNEINAIRLFYYDGTWLVSVGFNPTEFFGNIIQDPDQLGAQVTVSDASTTFFTNGEASLGDQSRQESIPISRSSWQIHTTLTQAEENTFNDNNRSSITTSLIVTAVIITGFFLLIRWIHQLLLKKKSLTQELTYNKQLNLIDQSNHMAMHEVRNLLNNLCFISEAWRFRKVTTQDQQIVREGVNGIVHIINDRLQFKLLLSQQYQPMYEPVDFLDLIRTQIQQTHEVQAQLTWNSLPNPVLIDLLRIRELFTNGFTNASKHHTPGTLIQVRLQSLPENYLMVEIINQMGSPVEKSPDEIQELFVPFLMKEVDTQHLWKEMREYLRMPLTDLQKRVETAKDQLTHQETIQTPHSSETSEEESGFQIASSGLGLSISRLIARAFEGDCNLEFQSDPPQARFWFLIRTHSPPASLEPDDTPM